MSGPARFRITLAAGATLALAALGACFSEERGATEPSLGDCVANVPVEPGIRTVAVVEIRDFLFIPDTIRVAPGTVVAWADCEPPGFTESHTSTSDEGIWDSPFLNPGDSYSRVFDEPGTYPYHCEPHPFMLAVVIVE